MRVLRIPVGTREFRSFATIQKNFANKGKNLRIQIVCENSFEFCELGDERANSYGLREFVRILRIGAKTCVFISFARIGANFSN